MLKTKPCSASDVWYLSLAYAAVIGMNNPPGCWTVRLHRHVQGITPMCPAIKVLFEDHSNDLELEAGVEIVAQPGHVNSFEDGIIHL